MLLDSYKINEILWQCDGTVLSSGKRKTDGQDVLLKYTEASKSTPNFEKQFQTECFFNQKTEERKCFCSVDQLWVNLMAEEHSLI